MHHRCIQFLNINSGNAEVMACMSNNISKITIDTISNCGIKTGSAGACCHQERRHVQRRGPNPEAISWGIGRAVRTCPLILWIFCNDEYHSAYTISLRVYSLHHNVLLTLQSIPLMTNGPLYPITQDSSCHGQHTMPRNPWSFPWPVPHCCVLHECVCVCVAVAESVRSSSVAVVSGIYYSDHWWLQAYL